MIPFIHLDLIIRSAIKPNKNTCKEASTRITTVISIILFRASRLYKNTKNARKSKKALITKKNLNGLKYVITLTIIVENLRKSFIGCIVDFVFLLLITSEL